MMQLMSGMRMIWMGAGDGFVVVFVGTLVVVVVIVTVVGEMVVGDVSFARAEYGERLCLVVVLRGAGRLVVERVVGRRGLGCDVREVRFVGIAVGRLLSSCDGWILLGVFGAFVGRTLGLWFGFVVPVDRQKQEQL